MSFVKLSTVAGIAKGLTKQINENRMRIAEVERQAQRIEALEAEIGKVQELGYARYLESKAQQRVEALEAEKAILEQIIEELEAER